MSDARRPARASFDTLTRHSERLTSSLLSGDPEKDQRNVSLLVATINAASTLVDPREVLARLVDMIVQLTAADRGLLLLRDEEGELVVDVARDRDRRDISPTAAYSRSSVRRAVMMGRSLCIVDALEEDDPKIGKSVHELSLRTIMCVPLELRAELLGVMYVDSRLASEGFTGADLRVFEALCQQVAHTLEGARLDRALTRTEATNRAKNRFLAGMSQEIRTPLNAIVGTTRQLLEEHLNDGQRELARDVLSSADALRGIFDDLLDFSRIEADKLTLQPGDLDFRSFVEDLADALALQAQAKGLELVCPVELDVPTRLRGDAERLRQILVNLVHNAIEHTEHGEVSIWVSCGELDPHEVVLRFVVTDSGEGISAERLEQLFDPFGRRAETTRGSGLGLPIARRLVELMGGEIGVKSVEGEGSSFWFTVRLERQPEIAEPLPTELPGIVGKRVLVVDSSVNSRVWASMLLDSFGARVDAAADDDEALDLLRQASAEDVPYQLVLLDLDFAGLERLGLAERLALDASPQQPDVVLMVPLDRVPEVARLERRGVRACVSKPLKHSRLVECFRETFREQPARQAQDLGKITLRRAPRSKRAAVRVLVADDSAVDRRITSAILEKLGYAVDVATNGLEVLEALREQSFDVVLMDCQMPELDGYQATRAIRSPSSELRDPDIPVIALTAQAMEGDRQRCEAAGMSGHLTKPVDPERLQELMRRLLRDK